MDPITSAAIGGAVGGATGKFIEKALDSGKKWLKKYFEEHQPEAQEAAHRNMLAFLNDLAKRLQEVENSVKKAPGVKNQIEEAVTDPDFSALLHDCMIASARTSSSEKHRVLARLVSERLVAEEESLIALSADLACKAIPRLSPKHLRILAVLVLVYGTRPTPFPPRVAHEQFHCWWVAWLEKHLTPIMPVGKITPNDYAHLTAVSCIAYDFLTSRDLEERLSPPRESGFRWNCDEFLTRTDVGRELSKLWEGGMGRALATTVGRLIGIIVTDEILGIRTVMAWG